jgi:hypothetical protein
VLHSIGVLLAHWQWSERLGEQCHRLDPERYLAGLGREHVTVQADVIAQIEQLENTVLVVTHFVLANEELHLPGVIPNVPERGLAVRPERYYPARHPNAFLDFGVVFSYGSLSCMCPNEPIAERFDPQLAQRR